jgi:TRAP-type C4-dicarboxylate transport system substrate-binding protein
MKLLGCIVMLVAVLATPAAAKVDGPTVNWRFATFGKPRTGTTLLEAIKKYVEEKTDDKFTITIGYGTFGEPKEFLDLLKIGAIQGATVQASLSVDRLPLYTVLDLPFLPLAEPDVQRKVHDAFNARPEIREEFAAWNALPFMSSLLPQYELMGTTAPPKTLEDLKGLRVRALGGAGTALSKLGAVPYNMPASETYVAMDRGLLSGVAFPYYAYVSFRTYELGKWMTTNLSLGTTAFPLTLNLKAWNDLPPQYKDLLKEAREVAYEAQKEAVTGENDKALQTIKDAGLKLVEFSEKDLAQFREIGGKPVWEGWVKDMDRRGLAGQATLDFVLKEASKASKK